METFDVETTLLFLAEQTLIRTPEILGAALAFSLIRFTDKPGILGYLLFGLYAFALAGVYLDYTRPVPGEVYAFFTAVAVALGYGLSSLVGVAIRRVRRPRATAR